MASSSLPSNVHVSSHPCLQAKLSQLRSQATNARETKSLIHEIATILSCEALAVALQPQQAGKVSADPLLPPSQLSSASCTGTISSAVQLTSLYTGQIPARIRI